MNDIFPIVAQDYQTGEVRMVGMGNDESVQISEKTGKLSFWSRTKGRIWTKGETSGDFLEICERKWVLSPENLSLLASTNIQISYLYKVKQIIGKTGMTCHRGTPTCFGSDEFDIRDRLVLKDLNYKKMDGKVLVVSQSTSSNKVLGIRMFNEENVNYLVQNLGERCDGSAHMQVDCDNDTLLIRVPMEIETYKP